MAENTSTGNPKPSPVKKVLYIGNFFADYLTETHMANSLEELGIEVIRINEKNCNEKEIRAKAEGCDTVFYQRTFGMPFDFTKLGIRSVSYTLDLYFGLARAMGMAANPFWRADYVFTVDGGHAALFSAKGIRHHFLPAAVYGRECVMGTRREELACDVAFVGTYHYLKEWPYRKSLVNFLRTTYGSRFKLFGDVVDNKDPGYPVMAFGTQLNDVYASAKVVVCDSLNSPMYWSNRIYETLGRGGFAIHPKIEGLEKEFEYGKHLVPYEFGDFDRLKARIDYYLDHPAEREKIRRAGQNYAKKHKTFKQRASQILRIVAGETIDPFQT
jgi:hypothetical protein